MTFDDDGKALELLMERGFYVTRGIIKPGDFHELTQDEQDAIQYLCSEWDYGFTPARFEDRDQIVAPKGGSDAEPS